MVAVRIIFLFRFAAYWRSSSSGIDNPMQVKVLEAWRCLQSLSNALLIIFCPLHSTSLQQSDCADNAANRMAVYVAFQAIRWRRQYENQNCVLQTRDAFYFLLAKIRRSCLNWRFCQKFDRLIVTPFAEKEESTVILSKDGNKIIRHGDKIVDSFIVYRAKN